MVRAFSVWWYVPSGTVRCSMLRASSNCDVKWYVPSATVWCRMVESSWNVMAHDDAREGKWRGNWRMEWMASTLHTTSEHGVSRITIADAHTSVASSRLNWRPRRFKWPRPFRRKMKSGLCACAIILETQSTCLHGKLRHISNTVNSDRGVPFGRKCFLGRDKVCLTHTSLRMVQCCYLLCTSHLIT